VLIKPHFLFQQLTCGHDGCGHHAQVDGSVDNQYKWHRHHQCHPSLKTLSNVSRENLVIFTEMEEFFWGLQNDEEARKPKSEDVFRHDDEEATLSDGEKSNVVGGWTKIQETNEDEQPKV